MHEGPERQPDGGAYILFEERTEAVSTVGNLIKLGARWIPRQRLWQAGRLRVFYRAGSVDPTAIAVDGKGRIVGTRKANELSGTPRRDVIAALGGKDKVRGLAGPDLICGGKGQDTLLGGPARDEVRQ